MLQVRCPSCRRLLDVPEGSERATAVCPACQTTFTPSDVQATAITASVVAQAAPLETGIQDSRPIPRIRTGRKLASIKIDAGLSYLDLQIGATAFCVACVLGMVIAASVTDLPGNLVFVIPFACVAAALAVFYTRVARGFRGDPRQIYFWFYVVGSGLFVIVLPLTPLFVETTSLGDIFVMFLTTPFIGAMVGSALHFAAVLFCLPLPTRLRQRVLDILVPDFAPKEPGPDAQQADVPTETATLDEKPDDLAQAFKR
jgi:LSD1 subclass zinc finger protein